MSQLQNCIVPIGDWFPTTIPNIVTVPSWTYNTWPAPPTECGGDVHVFPCSRCMTCKCGKATLKKEDAKCEKRSR